MKFVVAILIFSFIIIFHELGHFLVAKKCNVKVNEFCLGLGPTIVGFTKGETKYSLKLFPFGGACIMEGEDETSDDSRSFQKKPLWQKAFIVAAGPVFNFILAYILSVVMIGIMGVNTPVVSKVMDNYPAQEAGITAGDTIVSLDHYQVHFYNEISIYTFFHKGQTIHVTYERNAKEYTTALTPKFDKATNRYYFGFTGVATQEHLSILKTLEYSFYELKYQVYVALQGLKMLVTGQLGVTDMSGPVGIVKTIGDTYDQSLTSGILYVVMNMINITILLSANLGVMNLIPIPALDGGRLLFFLIEAITKRKVSEEIEGKINFIGFALLMVLMVVVMFSDFYKIFS